MTFSDKKDEIEEHFKSGHNILYCVLSKRVMVNETIGVFRGGGLWGLSLTLKSSREDLVYSMIVSASVHNVLCTG